MFPASPVNKNAAKSPPIEYATDIAVLGGTHPAALVDPQLSATLSDPPKAQKRKRPTKKGLNSGSLNKKGGNGRSKEVEKISGSDKGQTACKRARRGTASKVAIFSGGGIASGSKELGATEVNTALELVGV